MGFINLKAVNLKAVKLPAVKIKAGHCCLVVHPHNGAKLIGLFYALLFFFSLIGPIVELNRNHSKGFTLSGALDSNMSALIVEKTDIFSLMSAQQRDSASSTGWMVALLVFLMAGMLVNVVMVWGVVVKVGALLLPWLAFQVGVVFAQLVAPIVSIYHDDYDVHAFADEEDRGHILLSFLPMAVGVLGIYFWTVVKKLHAEFTAKPDPVAPVVAPAPPQMTLFAVNYMPQQVELAKPKE